MWPLLHVHEASAYLGDRERVDTSGGGGGGEESSWVAQVADKVKMFFRFYSINRHKMTTLTPRYPQLSR